MKRYIIQQTIEFVLQAESEQDAQCQLSGLDISCNLIDESTQTVNSLDVELKDQHIFLEET